MNKSLISVLIALSLAACSTTPTDTTAPVEHRGATTGNPGAGTTATTARAATPTPAPAATANPGDPKNLLAKRSVYFDFDSFAIKDEDKSVIEAHGRYLQGSRNSRLTVEGNTDERGSREYNIALGQRRADAAKKAMMLMGATDVQIETISFGKEKPKNAGHDESAWAENRRDDLRYQGQ